MCSPVLVDSTAIRKNPARAYPMAGDDRLAGAPAGLLPGRAGPQPANYVACHRGAGLCGRVHQFGGHRIHRGLAGTLRAEGSGVLDGGGARPAAILADGGAQHLAQPVEGGVGAEQRWRGMRLLLLTIITNAMRRTEEIALAAEGVPSVPSRAGRCRCARIPWTGWW